MAIIDRELWYTANVTEAPQVFTFQLPFTWFVITAYFDEEDHGSLALPDGGRVEVEVRRFVGSGVAGAKELIGAADLVASRAVHILVKPEDHGTLGQYEVTVRYVGPTLTESFPLLVQAFGEGLKELIPTGREVEACGSLAYYVVFDQPLTSPVDFTVWEYLPKSGLVDFTGTPEKVEAASATIPAGRTTGRVVVDKAFSWKYEASVSGGSNPRFMVAGLPL